MNKFITTIVIIALLAGVAFSAGEKVERKQPVMETVEEESLNDSGDTLKYEESTYAEPEGSTAESEYGSEEGGSEPESMDSEF
ncbi:hypothetical protein ACFL5G_01420 [Candidatus Margulisiibacteriota bacterium]